MDSESLIAQISAIARQEMKLLIEFLWAQVEFALFANHLFMQVWTMRGNLSHFHTEGGHSLSVNLVFQKEKSM